MVFKRVALYQNEICKSRRKWGKTDAPTPPNPLSKVQDLLKEEGADEDGGKGGRALAVQDVNAPAEYVWDRILDFGNYNKMVR